MRIIVTDKKIEIKPKMGIGQITNYMLNALLSLYKTACEDNEALRQPIYDMFNGAASELLQHLIPDSDLHPNLTEQAILEMENAILDREVPDKKE